MTTNHSAQLIDQYGRHFPYLRLSLTDVCNFSCDYCLPNGYQCTNDRSFLSLNEVKHLATAFAELGTSKIRLTGGEPTLRKDFIECIKLVKSIKKIKQIAVTTNGYKLKKNINSWVDAGLTHLNISVDTLDPKLFYSLTGHNRLKEILNGIDHSLTLSLQKIKLNAVLLKDINSHQFDQYIDLIRNRPISIRFIELMQTGDNLDYFNKYHVSAQILKNYLFQNGWTEKLKDKSSGPAVEYVHADYQGSFGVIAPYSKDFCDTCNRLRVSSTGDFHLCLFGDKGYSIRHLLQSEGQRVELKNKLCELLTHKKKTHFLHDNNTGITPNLSSIGG
ncbi:MAG: GTP 3',8-cyclase MoaA [Kangiellaceae bacterium]|nr:GTP 3',8-cyclase MoaA [Kangiellaceae bacterium]